MATMFEESVPFEVAGLRLAPTPSSTTNAQLTAREILDRGAQRVTVELQDQPVVQAALKETMGNVFLGLGMVEKGELLLEEALHLRLEHLPREHVDTASSLHSIGLLRFNQQLVRSKCFQLFEKHRQSDGNCLATIMSLLTPLEWLWPRSSG